MSASEGRYEAMPPAQVAVSVKELQEWGCPSCGYRSGSVPIQQGGTAVWSCGECRRSCYALADGVEVAGFGGSSDGTYVLPLKGGEPEPEDARSKLQPHPRRGTPSHGRPDTRPEGGGEFFSSRGQGMDVTPSCFVCGREHEGYNPNIAAFVQGKAAGERVVAMFGGRGARLDYREHSPDRVQVKVGSCRAHLANLKELDRLTSTEGILTDEILAVARLSALGDGSEES